MIKGRWLVEAQARRSDGWRRDRFEVTFDEFTEDNLPNRLFKAGVERVSRWARWSDTQRHLAQLRSAFAEVTHHTPRVGDFDNAQRWMIGHRRRAGAVRHYQSLLHLARRLWVGAGPHPNPGKLETFAFLFNMNALFEEFIAEFIRRELRPVWQAHGWTLHTQSGRRHLLCDQAGHPHFKLVPDLRFETGAGHTALIVDTKYKRLAPVEARAGVTEADAYQMFAYKERHHCSRVILLYPQGAQPIARDFGTADANNQAPPWLEVRTVDLRRNLVKKSDQQLLARELAAILCQGKEPQ